MSLTEMVKLIFNFPYCTLNLNMAIYPVESAGPPTG